MGRAERLMDLAERLRGHEATTVAALAQQLRVSRRTLLRDLAALRERGMPIEGEAGPGGGIRLQAERGLLAVHLSLAEVVAIWLAARLSREVSELPWGRAANAAMAKLLSSVPEPRAKTLRALCRRVIIGPTASGKMAEQIGRALPDLLELFERAFSNGVALGFQYSDVKGSMTQRRVEPHGLVVVAPVWYVLGRDVDKSVARMFRMDRITRPRLIEQVRFQPDLRLLQSQFSDLSRWRPLMGRWLDP